jgi:hypothetical protein
MAATKAATAYNGTGAEENRCWLRCRVSEVFGRRGLQGQKLTVQSSRPQARTTTRLKGLESLPAMDHRHFFDLIDAFENPLVQFLQRLHADMFKEGVRHLSKQCLGEIQPGAVRRSQHVLEAVGTRGKVSPRLLGNMRGVIVQDRTDCAAGRVVRIRILEPCATSGSTRQDLSSRHSSERALDAWMFVACHQHIGKQNTIIMF